MDKLNELGFVNFWGVTPAINAFYGEDELLEKPIFSSLESLKLDLVESTTKINNTINLLIANAIDIRHILKTLSCIYAKVDKLKLSYDNSDKNNIEKINIDFYIYETFPENIVRLIVFFELILNSELNNIEKVDMFLEIYANCLVTEKTHTYLHNAIKRLTDLLYGEKVEKKEEKEEKTLNLHELLDFSFLGYKDLDNFKDILDSYNKDTKFDIEKLREERLRFLFKDRYDSRENLIDWDYQMKTRKNVDHIGYNCYKRFRMNGVAFEKHNIKYNKPNKTLSSYIPGRSVSKIIFSN